MKQFMHPAALLASFGLALACAAPGAARAADAYPVKPIRLLVGFAPGGANDLVARAVATRLGPRLNQQIIVENRAGAGGNIATELAARSAPDGYTLVLNTIPLVTNVSLFEKLSWDPIRDFAPVGMVATAPHVLIVPKRLQANNVQELLKLARANPGKMSYASAGYGTTFHFAAEMFKDITKTFILHVPYRGGGPALVDTLSGQVDMSFPTLSAVLPHVKAGNLKALAVTGATRSELLPDVPTMEQAGVKDFVFTQWLALVAPAAIPRDIVTKLNASLNTALGSKELREKFQQQGFEPFTTTPEDTGKFLAGEVKRYSSLIKSKGIKAE
jgi:tripartite-type tricarboxylate transporter receptor subunit TctC